MTFTKTLHITPFQRLSALVIKRSSVRPNRRTSISIYIHLKPFVRTGVCAFKRAHRCEKQCTLAKMPFFDIPLLGSWYIFKEALFVVEHTEIISFLS